MLAFFITDFGAGGFAAAVNHFFMLACGFDEFGAGLATDRALVGDRAINQAGSGGLVGDFLSVLARSLDDLRACFATAGTPVYDRTVC